MLLAALARALASLATAASHASCFRERTSVGCPEDILDDSPWLGLLSGAGEHPVNKSHPLRPTRTMESLSQKEYVHQEEELRCHSTGLQPHRRCFHSLKNASQLPEDHQPAIASGNILYVEPWRWLKLSWTQQKIINTRTAACTCSSHCSTESPSRTVYTQVTPIVDGSSVPQRCPGTRSCAREYVEFTVLVLDNAWLQVGSVDTQCAARSSRSLLEHGVLTNANGMAHLRRTNAPDLWQLRAYWKKKARLRYILFFDVAPSLAAAQHTEEQPMVDSIVTLLIFLYYRSDPMECIREGIALLVCYLFILPRLRQYRLYRYAML